MFANMREDLKEDFSIPFEDIGGKTHYLDSLEVSKCKVIDSDDEMVHVNHPKLGGGSLMSIDLD